jgi:hypothetical protein
MVRVLGGNGHEWKFDVLADEILPLTRTELHDLRIQRAINDTKQEAKPKPTSRRHQTLSNLWAVRLTDINTLIQLRYPENGQIPNGERDAYIFLTAVCMSWLSSEPQVLEQEITRFA